MVFLFFFWGDGIAYVLIGGSHKCRHIADRGGRGSKKAQKLRTYLKNVPLLRISINQDNPQSTVKGSQLDTHI